MRAEFAMQMREREREGEVGEKLKLHFCQTKIQKKRKHAVSLSCLFHLPSPSRFAAVEFNSG